MKGNHLIRTFISLALAAVVTQTSHAAVRPMLTRVVAYATDKETAVDIINDAPQAYMVQSWLEDLNGNDDNLPLILTPPVMRLEGKKQGKLRLVVIPAHIPRTESPSTGWRYRKFRRKLPATAGINWLWRSAAGLKCSSAQQD